jgi:hypothetical protein
MVSDVPPPPLDEISRGSRAVTAEEEEIVSQGETPSKKETISLPIVSTRPVNIVVDVTVLICKGMTKSWGRSTSASGPAPSGVVGVLAEFRSIPVPHLTCLDLAVGEFWSIIRSFFKQPGTRL